MFNAPGIGSVVVADASQDAALAARLWDACLERVNDSTC